MFFSLAMIMTLGFLAGEICKKLHLPALMGMLAIGILIGPYMFNLIDESVLGISAQLRKIALIIILTRAGLSLDIEVLKKNGRPAVILILAVLVFRMAGVCVCMIKTNLSMKERLFCMLAYLPKATVQAAIGGIPLAMGLSCGETVLTVAVLSIIITAPLGAFLIDLTYKRLLNAKNA